VGRCGFLTDVRAGFGEATETLDRALVLARRRAPSVVVIDKDRAAAALVADVVESRGRHAIVARSLADGDRALDDRTAAVIMDLFLPEDAGFDFIGRVRSEHGSLPILGLSKVAHARAVNEAYLRGVEFACKPDVVANVARFIELRTGDPETTVRRFVAELSRQHDLTHAESRLLIVAAMTTSRRSICVLLGVTPNTVKKHIKSLLSKTGAATIEDIVGPVRERTLRW
jgi:DNA-binding NarL/FixJ family response regulator